MIELIQILKLSKNSKKVSREVTTKISSYHQPKKVNVKTWKLSEILK